MNKRRFLIIGICAIFLLGSARTAHADFDSNPKKASTATIESNNMYLDMLDFNDETEFEFANRGFIDAPDTMTSACGDTRS